MARATKPKKTLRVPKVKGKDQIYREAAKRGLKEANTVRRVISGALGILN